MPEEIYKILFENAFEGLLVITRDRIIRFSNPAAHKLLLPASGQLQGHFANDFIKPAEQSAFDIFFDNIFSGALPDEEIKTEFTFLKNNGASFPAELYVYGRLQLESGDAAVIAFRDVSEKERSEKRLRQSEQQIRYLIEHTPAAVAMFDKQMRYIVTSKRWLEDYRLTDRDITGLSHYDIFPEIGEEWKAMHQRCLQGETFKRAKDPFPRKDGRLDWIRWELCPWYNEETKIGGVILFSEVITDRIVAQQELSKREEELTKLNQELEIKIAARTAELTQALERAKVNNDLKSRFISTASHEFRTPLSTLLSSLYLLERYYSPLPDSKEMKHFNRIKSAVNHLTEILNDFLSLDKLEHGEIVPEFTKVNLKELALSVMDDMRGLTKKGQEILFTYKGREELLQDGKILRNTLYNLLSNAIKFSEQDKKIRLDIDVSPEHTRIIVKDEGIGIPADEQRNMFSRLFRARNAVNVSGTGLGLNIVKHYLEIVGGTVRFESEYGHGTTFFVDLPAVKM